MARKSDRRRSARISATEASRDFSRLLDRVEEGSRFLVHRHGRDVCEMAPPAADGRPASACLAIARSRVRIELDDRFGADLLSVLASETPEDGPRWGS